MKTNNDTLIDGATLYGVSAIFRRLDAGKQIRLIDVVSLASLIEAYVLHDHLVIDEAAWADFCEIAPPQWIDQLQKAVYSRPLPLHTTVGLADFLTTDQAYLTLNSHINAEDTLNYYAAFHAYAGADIGQSAEQDEIVHLIASILKEAWGWQYPGRNNTHVDVVLGIWRGVQYSEFASEFNLSFQPHAYRAGIFNSLGLITGQFDPSRGIADRIIRDTKSLMEENLLNRKILKPSTHEVSLYRTFEQPLFALKILRQSQNLYDVFDQASMLREKAKPLRSFLKKIEISKRDGNYSRFDGLIRDYEESLREISGDLPTVAFSIGISVPWGLVFGMTLPLRGKPKKHIALLRDLFQSHTIPFTLESDIKRLFGLSLQGNWQGTLNHFRPRH